MKKEISFHKAGLLIFLCGLIVGGVAILYSARIQGEIYTQTSPHFSIFEVEDGVFVAHIMNATSVELWEVASSTESRVGNMDDQDGRWTFRVPANPRLVYTYEVRAYDNVGRLMDSRQLEIVGENDIYTHLWGPLEPQRQTIGVGETFTYDDLTFTITEIIGDSRCPVNVQCIQAGYVTFTYDALLREEEVSGEMRSDEEEMLGSYILRVVSVVPDQIEGRPVLATDLYEFDIEVVINVDTLPVSFDTI